ncbi:Putative uncharacterized protein [Taphrina deformans PYCC 5710]|uniref:Uncharacterized protein n=1 Tax=Taphrina deformans (strain PYCC 5710 / ATCC 11124 / CBS 356.35 / IMI 108563 / JCM 9778 / NBRC 8474) TaxID=1097556 RepID=R4X955_TAPDE|nr:Putative uncharacterized protein [Taphrina deformans PYCC 5710]|eukprot:CCG80697.1 Putative uncharacterized protein [Taphrina deformans PYCC 5710]
MSGKSNRCRVYTYYDKTTKSEDTEALLQVWLKSWWALGLYPVILTNEISIKHPEYKSLRDKYADAGFSLERLDAILAMDYMNYEGMLTAPYVFPIASTNDAMLKQMRQCQVLDVMTKYRSSRDDIMRGSSMAYKILVKALVTYNGPVDKKRVGVLGIEGVPGANFRELEDTKTFAVYDKETVEKLYPKLYDGRPVGKGGKTFTFVKSELAALVNGHLQDNFLVNHRNGIEVLSPELAITDSDFTSRSSLRIAMELTRCNLTPLPKTCSPQHASSTTKCFDCTQLISSAIIKPVTGFVPKNATFFIGSVPHPLTLLALEKMTTELDAATIRDSKQNAWSKGTLTQALPRHSGAIQGLVFLSNSLYSHEDLQLPDAHMWHLLEQDVDAGEAEYTFGFSLPELKTSLDQLAQSSKQKSTKFQENFAEIKALVGQPLEKKVTSKAMEVTEAWSQYDAGAHQLIKNYIRYRSATLQAMKRENSGAFVVLALN